MTMKSHVLEHGGVEMEKKKKRLTFPSEWTKHPAESAL